MRVYRLHVTYPPGSHDGDGVPVPGWEPSGWRAGPDLGLDEGPAPFTWPRVRAYLSASGAAKRAQWFREFGATVEIEASKLVEWEEDRS